MPGRLFLEMTGDAVGSALGVPAVAIADQPARQNIAPGQQIVTLSDGGLSLMRWGIIPVGRVNARGRPVMEMLINARSETVFEKSAYEGVRRAVVPVSGWYEWTGEKRRKTAWRIARKDGGLLMFAAIIDVWDGPGGITLPQVATITCPPNSEIEPIHHRMGVILHSEDVGVWLSGDLDTAKRLMLPMATGELSVEPAKDVDWDGP